MAEGDATEEALWSSLWSLGGTPAAREKAAAAALSFARPAAAVEIVRRALALCGKGPEGEGRRDV
jgi:hypothetical protein